MKTKYVLTGVLVRQLPDMQPVATKFVTVEYDADNVDQIQQNIVVELEQERKKFTKTFVEFKNAEWYVYVDKVLVNEPRSYITK